MLAVFRPVPSSCQKCDMIHMIHICTRIQWDYFRQLFSRNTPQWQKQVTIFMNKLTNEKQLIWSDGTHSKSRSILLSWQPEYFVFNSFKHKPVHGKRLTRILRREQNWRCVIECLQYWHVNDVMTAFCVNKFQLLQLKVDLIRKGPRHIPKILWIPLFQSLSWL